MKQVSFNENWHESVKILYEYDQLEKPHLLNRKSRHYQVPYENRRNFVFTYLERHNKVISSIFDIGAAQGNFSLPLAEMGFQVIWNDIRPEILEYVRLKYEFGEVQFIVGNIFDLKLEQKFDCVLITEIIEHVAHPNLFLAKCKEFLNEEGIIVMTTPNGRYFRNKLPKFSECIDPSVYENRQFKPDSDGHIFLLHPDEIQYLAETCGFELTHLFFFNNFFSCGHLKIRKILPYTPIRFIRCLESITRKLPRFISSRIHAQSFAILRKKI